MAKYKCPNCGEIFEGPAQFCPYCGKKVKLPQEFKYKCPVCGGTHVVKCEVSPMINNSTFLTGLPGVGFATKYVCLDCGYLMEFFPAESLADINKKYGK